MKTAPNPSDGNLQPPKTLLFDWHGTLADTHDAMYRAVDQVLSKLVELDLIDRMVEPQSADLEMDRELIEHVLDDRRLPPKIKADRKVSRTDLFEILFGGDMDAKRSAHSAFDSCYRDHCGAVDPNEAGIHSILTNLKAMNLQLGVLSNRKREFVEQEIQSIESGGWGHLFETLVCGDEVDNRKPAPDMIQQALKNIRAETDSRCWYIGDSRTDILAANRAGVTAVFYNGAGWPLEWLLQRFPDCADQDGRPDLVVDSLQHLAELVTSGLSGRP